MRNHGAYLSFRYRGVRSQVWNVSISAPSYTMIDLLIYQLFDKIQHWVMESFWDKARLFFIARKKERFVTCPVSVLPKEILLYILELSDLRNPNNCSIDLDFLDLLFKRYLPESSYKDLTSLKEEVRKADIRFDDASRRGYYHESSLSSMSIYSLNYILKSVANFSIQAVHYLSLFIERFCKEIFDSAKQEIIKTKKLKIDTTGRTKHPVTPYHILLSSVNNEFFNYLGINPALTEEWKWVESIKIASTLPKSILSLKPTDIR